MVGGVAEYELVEEGRGCSGGEVHHKAASRSSNMRLNRGKRVADETYGGVDARVRVMNVAAHEAEFRADTLVYTKKFLAPGQRLRDRTDKEGIGTIVNRGRGDQRRQHRFGVRIYRDVVIRESRK